MRRAKTPLPEAISSTVSPGCKLSRRSLAGATRRRWKSLPSRILSSQNVAFLFQMACVSSFRSIGWEVFSIVIAGGFLSGTYSALGECAVLNIVKRHIGGHNENPSELMHPGDQYDLRFRNAISNSFQSGFRSNGSYCSPTTDPLTAFYHIARKALSGMGRKGKENRAAGDSVSLPVRVSAMQQACRSCRSSRI